MVDVVGIKFRNNGKSYYFDPSQIELAKGDEVIVETAKGLEFATVDTEKKQVDESEIVSPLKPVIRKATPEDCKQNEENQKKKGEAMETCKKKIADHNLEMKLIDAEFTFDNSKVIFYFTAEGRVDFRELVKDLASVFHTRIELRQIGVRDESKVMGGIGNCGRELCCHQWISEFQPVSIKMAKTQNLSLNPSKISGVCGRLMCCLKYENEAYCDAKEGMPEVGERIETSDGILKVSSVNLLRNKIKARLVTDNVETGEEELSEEFYTYEKQQVKRLGKKKRTCNKCHE